jgi:nucleoside diphosphate kinase
MIERCFVMVKPELVQNNGNLGWEALHYLESLLMEHFVDEDNHYKSTRVVAVRLTIPRQAIELLYQSHKGKQHYSWLVDQCADKQVILGLYEGQQGLVEEIGKIAGHKDPANARKQRYHGNQTIRGKYSPMDETLEKSVIEKRGTMNGFHRSADIYEAMRELDIMDQIFNMPLSFSDREWHLTDLVRVLQLKLKDLNQKPEKVI